MKKKSLVFVFFAAALAVLGKVYRPVRVLCLCLAALLLVLTALAVLKRRSKRHAYRALLCLFCAAITVFSVLELQITGYDETDTETPVSAVVILGAGVNGTEPSLSLYVRLTAALDYLEDKPEIPVVVTGGQGGGEDITEAQCMADWLIAHGVAENRIILEEQATNTRENIEFSKAVLERIGVDTTGNIAVVTADYHLYRAHLYWGMPWMVPVAAKMPAFYWPLTLNYYIREAFAVAKLLVFGG